jgi:hypothetical protein
VRVTVTDTLKVPSPVAIVRVTEGDTETVTVADDRTVATVADTVTDSVADERPVAIVGVTLSVTDSDELGVFVENPGPMTALLPSTSFDGVGNCVPSLEPRAVPETTID